MDFFRKKPNREGWGLGDYFFENPPMLWKFLVFKFTPGNSRQNKALPLEILQNRVTLLGNFKA